MIRSPVSPLNKAIYERLKSAMKVAVYDAVPVGKKAPFVVLTDTAAQSWNTKTLSGALVTATIKVVSEYQGDKEVAELADQAISAIMHPKLLVSDNWQIVQSAIDNHTVDRYEMHREATITFKLIMIDIKEG